MLGSNSLILCPADMYETVRQGLTYGDEHVCQYLLKFKVTKISIVDGQYRIDFEGLPNDDA